MSTRPFLSHILSSLCEAGRVRVELIPTAANKRGFLYLFLFRGEHDKNCVLYSVHTVCIDSWDTNTGIENDGQVYFYSRFSLIHMLFRKVI